MGSSGGGGNSDADRFMALVDMLSDPQRTKEHLAELVRQVESHKQAIEAAKRSAADVRGQTEAEVGKMRAKAELDVAEMMKAAREEEGRVNLHRRETMEGLGAERRALDTMTRAVEDAKAKVVAREAAVVDRERRVAERDEVLRKESEALADKRRLVSEMVKRLA